MHIVSHRFLSRAHIDMFTPPYTSTQSMQEDVKSLDFIRKAPFLLSESLQRQTAEQSKGI